MPAGAVRRKLLALGCTSRVRAALNTACAVLFCSGRMRLEASGAAATTMRIAREEQTKCGRVRRYQQLLRRRQRRRNFASTTGEQAVVPKSRARGAE